MNIGKQNRSIEYDFEKIKEESVIDGMIYIHKINPYHLKQFLNDFRKEILEE